MKIRELTTVALRVLCVFIVAQGIMHVADIARFWALPASQRAGLPWMALSLAWLLAPLALAAVIWLAAPALARLATRGMDAGPVVHANVQTLVSAAFMVAGTVLFVVSLPTFIGHAVSGFMPAGPISAIWLLASALQCVLGLALALGAGSLSRLLLRLRRIGVDPAAGDG